jgi:hypothetical protein
MKIRAFRSGLVVAVVAAVAAPAVAQAQTTRCDSIELSVYGSTTPARSLQTHDLPRKVYGTPRCGLADRFARFFVAHLPSTATGTAPTRWRPSTGKIWTVSSLSGDNQYTRVTARRGSYLITFQF